MIHGTELDNPENDLQLDDRPARTTPAPRLRKSPTAAELAALREEYDAMVQRVGVARKLKPARDGMHCLDCWQRGRDAALRMVEGTGE